jgi:hypothetical protein
MVKIPYINLNRSNVYLNQVEKNTTYFERYRHTSFVGRAKQKDR